MTEWFTSDLHLQHPFVAALRGCSSVEEHDAAMAAFWDDTVHKKDTVWILGDLAMRANEDVLRWVEARPGVKRLIAGNHDPVHPMNRPSQARMQRWLQVFETVAPFWALERDGVRFQLSHFPFEAWGDGEGRPGSRHNEWRAPDVGQRLLHGHTHGREVAHGRQFHVGWDAHSEFVPLGVVLDWARGKA